MDNYTEQRNALLDCIEAYVQVQQELIYDTDKDIDFLTACSLKCEKAIELFEQELLLLDAKLILDLI